MNSVRSYCAHWVILVVVFLASTVTARSQLVIQGVQPTDVTPSGFSIVWETSEASTPWARVFSDAAGTNEITRELEMTAFPLIGGNPAIVEEYLNEEAMDHLRDLSKALGSVKIRLHGCIPETTYYFRAYAEAAGGEVTFWPSDGLASVTTAKENSFIGDSKQLLVALVDPTGPLDATGWLLTASTTEGHAPTSTYVGDGTGLNQAYLNLSHIFGTDGLSWTPTGNKELTITIRSPGSVPILHNVSLDFTDNFQVAQVHPLKISIAEVLDSDGDGLPDDLENRVESCTDPLDADTDDDGIPDGVEDANQNGIVDPNETDPCNRDTDGDGIQDGTEMGVTDPVPDPDGAGPLLGTDLDIFVPDSDPSTTTDPTSVDSDGDGFSDGVEDANKNGVVNSWETDPYDALSIPAVVVHLKPGFNLVPIHVAGDLEYWLNVFGNSEEIEKVMAWDSLQNEFVSLAHGESTSFALFAGEGLIVYSKVQKDIGLAAVECPTLDLGVGFNLVAFGCPDEGYSAFQLLSELGASGVSSIQRFSSEKGAFETAALDPDGQPVGIDFLIVSEEGYFIYLGM